MQDRSIVGRCPIELLTDVGLCVVDRGAELKEAAEGARLPRRHAGLRSWFGFRRQVLEFWRARQDLNPRPLARIGRRSLNIRYFLQSRPLQTA